METLPPLSASEFFIIEQHNNRLAASIEESLERLRRMPGSTVNPYLVGQIKYQKAQLSTLKWSTGVARQRLFKEEKHGRAAI